MGAAEACNEVVFESLDGLFGCISTMDAGGHKLVVHFIVNEIFFEHC